MSVVSGIGQRLRQAISDTGVIPAFSPFAQPTQGRGRVLAVAAQKGGVGKTTTAVHLAAALAMNHGLRVLLVDLDNQGHVASSLRAHVRTTSSVSVSNALLASEPDLLGAALPTMIDGLHITGADKQLSSAEAQLAGRMGREMLLMRALRNARVQYDAIVLDCPPNLGLLTVNALLAADHVLIPCDLSVLSLEGVDDLMRTLGNMEAMFGRSPRLLGLLHPRVDRRNQKQNATIRRAVAERYAGLPFQTEIGVNTALPGAQLQGQSIFHAQPDSSGARDYAALAAEVHGKIFA